MEKCFLPAFSLRSHWYPLLLAKLSLFTPSARRLGWGVEFHAHFTDRELMQPEHGLLGLAQSLR